MIITIYIEIPTPAGSSRIASWNIKQTECEYDF